MTSTPCILVVTEEHHVAIDRVIEAQGRGAGSFVQGRRLVAIGTTEPIVGRMCQDMSATGDLESAWKAYAATGDLPAIPGVWGENGVISAADAQAAHVGMTVHSVAGAVPVDWAASVLAGHGLMFVPEAEI